VHGLPREPARRPDGAGNLHHLPHRAGLEPRSRSITRADTASGSSPSTRTSRARTATHRSGLHADARRRRSQTSRARLPVVSTRSIDPTPLRRTCETCHRARSGTRRGSATTRTTSRVSRCAGRMPRSLARTATSRADPKGEASSVCADCHATDDPHKNLLGPELRRLPRGDDVAPRDFQPRLDRVSAPRRAPTGVVLGLPRDRLRGNADRLLALP
jgi:hypothetical protein